MQQSSSDESLRYPDPGEVPLEPGAVLDRLVNGERGYFSLTVIALRRLESVDPSALARIFERGVDAMLENISYSPTESPPLSKVVYHRDLVLRDGEELSSRYPVDPAEFPKINYLFGSERLSQLECIALVGSSFPHEAASAVAAAQGDYRQGAIERQIGDTGVKLVVAVINAKDPFGQNPEVEPDYKVDGSHAVVPLASNSSEITGMSLLGAAVGEYRADFRKRYEPVLHGDTEGLPKSGASVEEIVRSAVRGKQVALVEGQEFDLLTRDGIFSDELRLYLLAKMCVDLKEAGVAIPQISGEDLADHIRGVLPLYREMIQDRVVSDVLVTADLDYRMSHRVPETPLAEAVKQEIIATNLEVLEREIIRDTAIDQLTLDERRRPAVWLAAERDQTHRISRALLVIFYHTGTGQIERPPQDGNFLPGDYSKLMTKLVIEPAGADGGEHYTIRLLPDEGELMSLTATRVVTGEDAPELGQGFIPPIRLEPTRNFETPHFPIGRTTQWGTAIWGEHVGGDSVFLLSLQRFNGKYGKR